MFESLKQDKLNQKSLLQKTQEEAFNFLDAVQERPAGVYFDIPYEKELLQNGQGGIQSLQGFLEKYAHGLAGSAGSRYLGYVTGGSTPAALMGDWLAGIFDQNVSSAGDTSANQVEYQSIAWLRDLFGLKDDFSGTFVSGATMSSFVGLAIARQWYGKQAGIDIAFEGLWQLKPVKILSATPHSSIYKAQAMLGMGRGVLQKISVMDNREAIDIQALEADLEKLQGENIIVVANSGTVNTVDFDDLEAIGQLKKKYGFYLHVDAAFGGFAACSPEYDFYMKGINYADSITIDMHKFLNVPYDSAVQFTIHPDLQKEVFQNSGAKYLEVDSLYTPFAHLTPENSRRFRALPTWFTLNAYGKKGYQEIVERNVSLG